MAIQQLNHTPGPWKWDEDKNGWGRASLAPAVITGTVEGLISVDEDDARLIAAAPDLLNRLKQFMERTGGLIEGRSDEDDRLLDDVKLLLKSIEG